MYCVKLFYVFCFNIKYFCYSRFALDTAALLGGNEFLVSQIYEDRCQQTSFTEKETSTLVWALNRLWRGQVIYTSLITLI